MGNNNYQQYSKPKKQIRPSVEKEFFESTVGTVVGGAPLRVRVTPTTKEPEKTVIDPGTEVTVTDIVNKGWYKVKLEDGTEGFCMSKFIAIES